jgi:hypothetical protein
MMLMILLQQEIEMLEDEPLHLSDDVWLDAPVPRQADGIEPELALAVGGADVDVRRFRTLIGIKVEPETADAKDRGHFFRVRSWW